MPTIKINNVTSRAAAQPLVRALGGKSFMKLEVGLAPARGSFDVLVSTNRGDTSEEELREMVMLLLCQTVLDMGSAPVLRALATGRDAIYDGDTEEDVRRGDAVNATVSKHYGETWERVGDVLDELGAGRRP